MSESPSARKDVADILEDIARKIRSDPEWGAGRPGRNEGGVTVFAGDELRPSIGPVDLFEDEDAITVTAETRNADPQHVHVTLAEDRLYIGLGEGSASVRKDVPLPRAVDEDAAVATLRNGILDVVLPLKKAR